MPKVSIIIASYNVQDYIEQCITSALGQTIKEVEVIVVDDGSTDNTVAICEKLTQSDNRLRLVKQANDGAPGKARNRGIDLATADYLLFLDSDDYISADCCDILFDLITSYNVDISIGIKKFFNTTDQWMRYDDKHLEKCSESRPLLLSEILNKKEHNYLCYNAQAKLFKKAIIQKNDIRFPEKIASQDTVFAAKYFDNIKTLFLSDKIVYYRRERDNDNNLSLTQSDQNGTVVNGRVIAYKLAADYFRSKNNQQRAWFYYKRGFEYDCDYQKLLICDFPDLKKEIVNMYLNLPDIKDLNHQYNKIKNNRWYKFSKLSRTKKIRYLIRELLKTILKPLRKKKR